MKEPGEVQNFGRRRFLQGVVVVGGLAAAGSLIAACGDDEPAAGSTPDTTPDSTPDSTPAVSTPDTTPSTEGAAGPASGLIGLTLNGLNDYTKGVTTGVYKALEGSG